ncbi:MAG: biotin--[acetyl-CoA-carboxylase] ligase [Lachnoclostridium sp.]|nr:biotin--[acetyl-CoA-carboxylase] ligase [Lachnoclostridium sp.]
MIAERLASEPLRVLRLDMVDSTNTYLKSLTDAPHGTAVTARCQTAGRGQRGNSWESAPGENVTMSMMLRPRGIQAKEQFAISEAVALGVANILRMLVPPGVEISVKWPNDIYAGDRKIAGILIENTLSGSTILESIAGIGVNINQEIFRSDAPNPVSLFQLTGIRQNVDLVARYIGEEILSLFSMYVDVHRLEQLHEQYLASLWRRNGYHPYINAATGAKFEAAIADVALTGHITLRKSDATLATFAFKEITPLL